MALRAAILGCGLIGSEYSDAADDVGIYTHAGAYRACADTELVAVCDRDEERRRRCADRWGVAATFDDAERLLAEARPEIVSVCTPDPTHYALTRAALLAPGVRAVLAEKPLARDLSEARELVSLARERGVVLAVNYSRRFAPSHRALRDFLRGGGIGDIQRVCGYYTKGLLHNGTHWLDLARFLCGEVASVRGENNRGETGPDPTLDVSLYFESGAVGSLLALDAAAFAHFEMDIVGTAGRVRLLASGHVFEVSAVRDDPRYPGYRELAPVPDSPLRGGLKDVLLHAVQDVVGCLRTGAEPLCSGRDGLAALEIAHAARESAREGAPVRAPAFVLKAGPPPRPSPQ